jgi:DNA ligase (NAD+)
VGLRLYIENYGGTGEIIPEVVRILPELALSAATRFAEIRLGTCPECGQPVLKPEKKLNRPLYKSRMSTIVRGGIEHWVSRDALNNINGVGENWLGNY